MKSHHLCHPTPRMSQFLSSLEIFPTETRTGGTQHFWSAIYWKCDIILLERKGGCKVCAAVSNHAGAIMDPLITGNCRRSLRPQTASFTLVNQPIESQMDRNNHVLNTSASSSSQTSHTTQEDDMELRENSEKISGYS